MKTSARFACAAAALLAALTLLAGCGGTTIDDDNGYDPGDPGYPRTINLNLAWRVVDPEGYPLGGVTMLIDGVAAMNQTNYDFEPLSDPFPAYWHGWLANWLSDEYQVVINYAGDSDTFELRASRNGWADASVLLEVNDYDAAETCLRGTLILYPIGGLQARGVTQASQVERAAGSAGHKRAAGHAPRVTLDDEAAAPAVTPTR